MPNAKLLTNYQPLDPLPLKNYQWTDSNRIVVISTEAQRNGEIYLARFTSQSLQAIDCVTIRSKLR